MDDEGEEDGNIQPPEDDSMSEGSVGTDGEDDADGEASDDTESESVVRDATKSSALTNGHHADSGKPKSYRPSKPQTSTLTSANGDTEAMMNGLKISDDNPAEEVHFDNMTENVERQALSESHRLACKTTNQRVAGETTMSTREYAKKTQPLSLTVEDSSCTINGQPDRAIMVLDPMEEVPHEDEEYTVAVFKQQGELII